MGKKIFGKVLICLVAVILCFGFIGVKEVHAATNKVINENTGVSYNTFSEAVADLSNCTGDVTLTVDGNIKEGITEAINVDYTGGSLTIKGQGGVGYKFISGIGTHFDDGKGFLELTGPGTYNHDLINFSERTKIESITNIAMYIVDSGANINFKGNIKKIENCTFDNSTYHVSGNIDTILSTYFQGLTQIDQEGYVGTISDTYLYGYRFNGPSVNIFGTVNTIDHCRIYGGHIWEGSGNGGLTIWEQGRLDRITGGTEFQDVTDAWENINECTLRSFSEFPTYLEPELADEPIREFGYGIYPYIIIDPGNKFIFPVSSDGYQYTFPKDDGSLGDAFWDTSYNEREVLGDKVRVGSFRGWPLKRTDIKASPSPTISKRLLQNGTDTISDMTFNFKFEQQSEWDGVSYVSTDASTAAPIADKSVTITSESEMLTSDEYVGDLTGKKLYQGKVENVLSDFDPKAAGTYCYLVKEDNSNPIPDVTYTGSQFIMLVEVEDTGNGVYKPTTVTNILYKDSAGKTKADYTIPPAVFDEKQELIFYNTYGTGGGTTPTGIMTNILPYIVIGGVGVGGLTLYVMLKVRRRRKIS